MRKIEVVPYDPVWQAFYRAEAARLAKVFGYELIAIHHIGSTSVPGLAAKPTIDIIIEVRDLTVVDALNSRMIALGYEPHGEFGIPGRRYFAHLDGEMHTHQVHVFQAGNPEFLRHLAFRDYLIAHPEEARAYGQLKTELAERFPFDAMAYMDGKDNFVRMLERRALDWKERITQGRGEYARSWASHTKQDTNPKSSIGGIRAGPIEAIIFDIGGVLVNHDNALLFQRLAEHCRSPLASPHAIRDAAVNSGLRTGAQSVPDFHAALVDRFAFEGDYNTFAELWVRGIDPIRETIALVHQLHGTYRLFVLSDTNEEHWQHVSKNYIDPELFEGVFLSHRLGMVKPNPRLFEHVIETIGCEPSHCIFVDDAPENVEAARIFGVNAYVFTSSFDLVAQLAHLGGLGRDSNQQPR